MKCPKCFKIENSSVTDSRYNEAKNIVRRRRECLSCGERWSTAEVNYKPKEVAVQPDVEKIIKALEVELEKERLRANRNYNRYCWQKRKKTDDKKKILWLNDRLQQTRLNLKRAEEKLNESKAGQKN